MWNGGHLSESTGYSFVWDSAPSASAVANASIQIKLLRGKAVVQTLGFRKCLDLSTVAGTGSRHSWKKCAQVEDFLQQVAEMKKVVRMLNNSKHCFQWSHSPWPSNQKLPHLHKQGGL